MRWSKILLMLFLFLYGIAITLYSLRVREDHDEKYGWFQEMQQKAIQLDMDLYKANQRVDSLQIALSVCKDK